MMYACLLATLHVTELAELDNEDSASCKVSHSGCHAALHRGNVGVC